MRTRRMLAVRLVGLTGRTLRASLSGDRTSSDEAHARPGLRGAQRQESRPPRRDRLIRRAGRMSASTLKLRRASRRGRG